MTTTTAPISASPLAVSGTTTEAAAITAARHLTEPDRLWICDLSQIWGGTNWLYFAYVLDHGSGRCLGWAPHRVPHTELIATALLQATTERRVNGSAAADRDMSATILGPRFGPASREVPVVFGRGCRHAELDFPQWAIPSAADAALCDAFIGGIRGLADEAELNEDRAWASMPEARRSVAEWIEHAYNRRLPAGSLTGVA
jgi:putative transposase